MTGRSGAWNKGNTQVSIGHEIERIITVDAHAVHGLSGKSGATAIGKGDGGWSRNGFTKGECLEFSGRAGQRGWPVRCSENPCTSRWIVSLLLRSRWRLSRRREWAA